MYESQKRISVPLENFFRKVREVQRLFLFKVHRVQGSYI